MKRPVVVALSALLLGLPAVAQHASAHASPAGHSAPAFHSSPAFHSAPAFHGAQVFHGPPPTRSAPAANRFAGLHGYSANHAPTAFRRPGVGTVGPRRPYNGYNSDARRHRRPYNARYGILGYGVQGYAVPVYPGADFYGYTGDSGDDDAQNAADQDVAQDTGQDVSQQAKDQPAEQGRQDQLPPWPYGGAPSASAALNAPPAVAQQDAVTLIFKDGRPPEQIHNYLLTRGTLFVGDQHRREIPVDDLDLPATAKANREAGVDFHLPTLPGS